MDKRLCELFEKMKSKNLFWSYSGDISVDEIGAELFAENVLKYGDVDDIRVLFECCRHDDIREIWIKRLLFDDRFKKLNFYLAEIFFEVDIERLKKERSNDDRANKLRLLASQNQGDFGKT
ncbi:MAG: hypothetical protein ACLFUN_06855 [Desulfobacterales bacterium]